MSSPYMRSSKAISTHPSFESVSTADCSSCPDVEETVSAPPEGYERLGLYERSRR